MVLLRKHGKVLLVTAHFRTLKHKDMKKILLYGLLIALGSQVLAAENEPVKSKPKFTLGGDGIYLKDSTWRIGGYAGITMSQVALYQWAPGGSNNFAFLVSANLYANYKKGNWFCDNGFDAKWGMVANGLIRKSALAKRNFQKNIDYIAIKTNMGYEVSKALFVGFRFSAESQITRSYDYSLTDTSGGRFRRFTISKFGAPAIITIGPGITWKPKEYFTLFISPVGGKMTFVTKDRPMRDTTTALDGTLVDNYYNDVDETRFGLQAGKSFMGELGLDLDLLFQKDIVKNVNWKSHLNVYVTYMNKNYNTELPNYYSDQDSLGYMSIKPETKHIPVVRWDNDIIFKVNKFLSATLNTRFVYQYNAQVPIDTKNNQTKAKGPDGITDTDKAGSTISAFNKLQIYEQFGIGLAFKF